MAYLSDTALADTGRRSVLSRLGGVFDRTAEVFAMLVAASRVATAVDNRQTPDPADLKALGIEDAFGRSVAGH